jgi:hypothetical protein
LIALETELEALDTVRDTDELTFETTLFTDFETLDAARDTDELTLETALLTDLETLETALLTDLETLETALLTDLETLETARDTDELTLETTLFTDLLTLDTALRMDLLTDLNDQAPEMFFISSSPSTLAPGMPLKVRTLPVKEREKASTLVVLLIPKAGSKKLTVFSSTLLTVT